MNRVRLKINTKLLFCFQRMRESCNDCLFQTKVRASIGKRIHSVVLKCHHGLRRLDAVGDLPDSVGALGFALSWPGKAEVQLLAELCFCLWKLQLSAGTTAQ